MKKILIGLTLLLASCSTPEKKVDAPEAAKPKIDRQGIRESFKKHNRYIRSCYQKTLTANPDKKMTGKVTLSFDIDPSGKAQNASVVDKKTSLKDAFLNQCLIEGVSSWDWPVEPNGLTVNVIYPLLFNDKPPADMQNKLDKFQKLRKK